MGSNRDSDYRDSIVRQLTGGGMSPGRPIWSASQNRSLLRRGAKRGRLRVAIRYRR